MLNLKTLRQPDIITIARWLLISELVFLLFSTALTNVVELAIFALFISSSTLRQCFMQAIKQPMVIATLGFYLWILIASIYGIETWGESLGSVWGWRKIMLLPLAMSLFNDEIWKNKLLIVFINTVCFFALLSFVCYFFDIHMRNEGLPSIVVRNHATQGIVFSVAAFCIATILISMPTLFTQRQKYSYTFVMIALLLNVLYLTPGRSGYLALIVLTLVTITSYAILHKRIIIPILVFAMLPLTLLSSPTVKERITQGINEMQQYNTADSATSMGIRILLWKNTIELIQERPVFGYGSGAFQKAYTPKVANEAEWTHNIVHDPHNQYLKIITEQGLIGLGAFIIMLLSSLRQTSNIPYRTLGIGILLVWMGNSLFSSHFSTFSEGRFIFLWCGVFLSSYTIKKA